MVFEDIQADASVAVDIRVIDFCGKVDLSKWQFIRLCLVGEDIQPLIQTAISLTFGGLNG